MSTSGLVMMILTFVVVITFAVYFFLKVLKTPTKSAGNEDP